MLTKKDPRKRRKLYKNLYNDFNYYDHKSYTINGLKGVLYALDNPDMALLEMVENDYQNTKIITTYCEYAPEIHKTWLFIAR